MPWHWWTRHPTCQCQSQFLFPLWLAFYDVIFKTSHRGNQIWGSVQQNVNKDGWACRIVSARYLGKSSQIGQGKEWMWWTSEEKATERIRDEEGRRWSGTEAEWHPVLCCLFRFTGVYRISGRESHRRKTKTKIFVIFDLIIPNNNSFIFCHIVV